LNLAESDPRFQQIVAGKPYEYSSYGFVNLPEHPDKWYPSLTFRVGDKDAIVVTEDLNIGTVKDVKYAPSAYVSVGANNPDDNTLKTMQYFDNIAMISGLVVAIGSIAGYILLIKFRKEKKALLS
jgi:hypothetical protein